MSYYSGAQGDFYRGANRQPAFWGAVRNRPRHMPRAMPRLMRGDYYRAAGDYYQGDFFKKLKKKAKKALGKVAKIAPSLGLGLTDTNKQLGSMLLSAATGGGIPGITGMLPGGGMNLLPANLTAGLPAPTGGGPIAVPQGGSWFDAILGKTSVGKALDVTRTLETIFPTGALAKQLGWKDPYAHVPITAKGLPNANYDYGMGEGTPPIALPDEPMIEGWIPERAPRRRRKKKTKRRAKRPYCPVHKRRHTCKTRRGKRGKRVSFIADGKRVSFTAKR